MPPVEGLGNLDQNARTLLDVPTPAIVVELEVLRRNCAAMSARASRFGVRLRPHLKTAKSAEVAALATANHFGGICVSTLAEACYFISRGFTDVTYAVGLDPKKIHGLLEVQRTTGARIKVIADNMVPLEAARDCCRPGDRLEFLIELDTGGGRGGLDPGDTRILELARFIEQTGGLSLSGVLTHAGHSYHAHGLNEIKRIAEQERAGAVYAAGELRRNGLACEVVSVGSTPTMVHAESLEGVTEIRPGVYVFFDLAQASLGVCDTESIAASVLCTIIGHNRKSNRLIIDGGALALSKDLSACEFWPEVGYGLVTDLAARPIPGLYVEDVHQEHGFVCARGGDLPWDELPVGSRVRVLPNHVCMTVAPFDRYYVVDASTAVKDVWHKASGWHDDSQSLALTC